MLRHAGIGTYIRHVVPRIVAARPDWRFTLLGPRGTVLDWGVESLLNAMVVPCWSKIYTLSEQLELPLRASRADLFWSPHYNIPMLSRASLVVTVHDVAHLAMPEIYAGGLKLQYARHVFNAVRRRAREVIFDSEFSHTEFLRYVGEPRHATTIHLGVGSEWSEPIPGPSPHPRPYILFVGSAKPHKNLGTLLEAFDRLRDTIAHDLIIIGGQEQRTVDTMALGVATRLGGRVVTISDADDVTLRRFVAHAAALVLPSLYEGFGLPPLEAMAAGCPTIVSTAASLIEVCGNASLYCDPMDSDDMARQIVRLLGDADLRARLIKAGRTRAVQFDWDVCAARTAAVIERAL